MSEKTTESASRVCVDRLIGEAGKRWHPRIVLRGMGRDISWRGAPFAVETERAASLLCGRSERRVALTAGAYKPYAFLPTREQSVTHGRQ